MIAALRIHLECIRIALASRMAYRGDFFISVAMLFIGEFVAPLIIYLVYSTGSSFPGWNLYEVLLIQAIFLISKGIAFPLFFGMVWRTLRGVREGTFDLLLLKPRPVLYLSIVTAFDIDDLGKLIGGVLLLVISLSHLPPPNVLEWLQFAILLALSVLMLLSCVLLMSGSVFKWVGNSRVYEIFDCLTSFGQYPRSIFSRSFQTILSFIIPIAMLGFFPASALLGKPAPGMGWASAACIAFFLLCLLFWNRMLRYYTSAGG